MAQLVFRDMIEDDQDLTSYSWRRLAPHGHADEPGSNGAVGSGRLAGQDAGAGKHSTALLEHALPVVRQGQAWFQRRCQRCRAAAHGRRLP